MSKPQDYKGNGNHDWEVVTHDTERLRVPGGWLYRNSWKTTAAAFVPLPENLDKFI